MIALTRINHTDGAEKEKKMKIEKPKIILTTAFRAIETFCAIRHEQITIKFYNYILFLCLSRSLDVFGCRSVIPIEFNDKTSNCLETNNLNLDHIDVDTQSKRFDRTKAAK